MACRQRQGESVRDLLGIGEVLGGNPGDERRNVGLVYAGVAGDRGVGVELIWRLPHRADGEDHHLAHALIE